MLCLAPRLRAGTPVPQPATSDALPLGSTYLSFWSASARAHAAEIKGGLRRRARFFLRAMSQPRLTRAWLARLVQPDISPLWAARPRLALKLQRPYVSCAWDSATRFAALTRHYEILCQVLAPEVRAAVYGDGLDIVRVTHPESGTQWDLRLFYHDKFEREGEMTLALREVKTGVMIASLTFCLAHNSGKRIAIIGGMQSSRDPRTRGLIHDAAKCLCGMRPKALLVWCLQQLAGPWQLTQIQAVGDGQHVWRHWTKQMEIAASYDEFWRECDGRSLPGGGSWDLPLKNTVRPRGELKPSRRKMHERRYALLDALHPTLLSTFANLAPTGQVRSTLASVPVEFVCPVRDQPGRAVATPLVADETVELSHAV
jgi:uncharacterized protein VirK/YbjX